MIWVEEPNDIKSKAAVFAIYWLEYDKIYIGKSTNAFKLYKQYLANMKANKANYHLQKIYNELGIPRFKYLYRTLTNDLDQNFLRLREIYKASLLN